jgi:DNA-binding Lrp family transcriptional regulator
MDFLDVKNRKILHELDMNARQSFSQIGKKVGLPKSVVSYRIKKLLKSGVIKNFYTAIDTFKLGYISFRIYINYQYTTPKIEEEIRNHFINEKLNWWTISSEGRYDLAIIMWVKEINDFNKFWEKTLLKYRDYFREQHFSIYIQSYSFFHDYLINDDYMENRKQYITSGIKNNNSIDTTDLKILNQISSNARISFMELSDIIGISFISIKQRINKMIKNGIIQGFRADIDFSKIGFEYYKADIYLKNYNCRNTIISYIKHNPYLLRIDKSVGLSDLELEFHVKDINHFQKIIDDISSKFKLEIKNYKYLRASKLYKMGYLPDLLK